MAKNKYLDIAGLQIYDTLIKKSITDGDAKALKSFKFDKDTRTLNFYKSETPGTTPDFMMILPEQDLTGFIEKIQNATKDNLVIIGEGGIVVDSNVALSDIATKTEIGDISQLNTTAKTDLVSAVNEVKTAIAAGGEAGVITITTDVTTDGVLKSYPIKQGGVLIGTIDIPKDLVVSSGSVVKNPEGQEAGTYIKLVIANQEEALFINVGTLVDIYIVEENATQIQLAINPTTREISATIVSGSVGTTELADNAVTTVKIADANVTLAKLAADAKAAFDSAGAASTAETNAKTYADGLNTAMDNRMNAVEEKIGNGYEAITESEINALFGVIS